MNTTNNSGHRQRLRRRLLNSHGNALEDYELLELLLFAAHPREDVKWIAKSIFFHFDQDINKVFNAKKDDLLEIDCVTDAIVSVILCCSVMFERVLYSKLRSSFFDKSNENNIFLGNYESLLKYVRSRISSSRRESVFLLYLNSIGRLITDEVLDCGTLDEVSLYVRELVSKVLRHGAKSLILAHNHPSGSCKPSKSDIILTEDLLVSCKALGIVLIDHIIITDDDYFSFYMNGLLI